MYANVKKDRQAVLWLYIHKDELQNIQHPASVYLTVVKKLTLALKGCIPPTVMQTGPTEWWTPLSEPRQAELGLGL